MAVGDLLTADFQWELAETLLLGPGTELPLIAATGLGLDELRSSDVNRPRDHGMLAGVDYLTGRTLTLEVQAFAASHAALRDHVDAIARAAAGTLGTTDETTLAFQLDGTKFFVRCRIRRVGSPFDNDAAFGLAELPIQLQALDPRIYAVTATSVPLSPPTSSGGLGFPFGFPMGFGSGSSAAVAATNDGTMPTPISVVFTGPLTGQTLENLTTGESWASSFDLQSGDTLTVDFQERTVLLNGTASRYSYVTPGSDWWDLDPGTSSIRLGTSAGAGSATVTFNSAWLLI